MATPEFTPDESVSSKPSNLHAPHERTSLLEPDRDNNATWTSAGHSASRPHLQDAPRPADGEATAISGSTPGKTDSKLNTGMVGIISVLLLGVFIANADGSIVLATYSTISSELDSLENASWLVVTYSLAVCAIQPTYGKLSDLYGRKPTIIVAYIFFALGCALS